MAPDRAAHGDAEGSDIFVRPTVPPGREESATTLMSLGEYHSPTGTRRCSGSRSSRLRHDHGATLALEAFPDVKVRIADVLR